MDSTSGRVQVRCVGQTLVARPGGPEVDVLYESSLIGEIGQALYDLAKENPNTRMVVNLDGVRYASTEMIAKLVSLNSRVERAGGRLTLCGLQPDVRESMTILKLLDLFHLAATEDEALGGPDPQIEETTVEYPKID